MERCGNRQTLTIAIARKSRTIRPSSFRVAHSAGRCGSRALRNSTSIQYAIGKRSIKRLHRTDRGHQSRQSEFFVRQLRSTLNLRPIDYDGDLDLRRRNKLNVNPAFAEAIEQACGNTGVRPHPDTDHAELGYSG